MKVSVAIPTYSLDRYDDFVECVEAVLNQTYDDIEVVIVVDGSDPVYERAVDDFGTRDDVVIFGSTEDAGPISRGNMGAVQATGDIIAFTDDDAIPDRRWIEELVDAYNRHDAVAVGGRLEPKWVAGYADFLPEEFYWLIGATHRGFGNEEREVRNTFGANLSFKRDVFLELGGLRTGGIQSHNIQGRETELCARLKRAFGQGVIYNPQAVVSHRVYPYRMNPWWLLRRAFWQGYSKRAMEQLLPESSEEESTFLSRLLGDFLPQRVRNLIKEPEVSKAKQLAWIFFLLAAVGSGYLYALPRWR